jgi:transposase
MSANDLVAGIDCGKLFLDVAVSSGADTLRVANTAEGHAELAAWLAGHRVVRVGLEASGGYERPVRDALRRAGLAVGVFDPARVRHYAKALGRRAKNDTIDAAVIAAFTAVQEPGAFVPAVEPAREELAGLVKARRLLVDKRADLRRARASAPALAQAALDEAVEALTRAIADLDAGIAQQVAGVPALAETVEALRSVPGVGPVVAVTLAARLPELGRIPGAGIAALVGVAPFDRDSGQARGPRRIAGGRADVRRALYMAAEVAATHCHGSIAAYYRRLRERGKAPKPALIACAHKLIVRLNVMLAKGGRWEEQPA